MRLATLIVSLSCALAAPALCGESAAKPPGVAATDIPEARCGSAPPGKRPTGADRFFQCTDFSRYLGRTVNELLAAVPFRYEERLGLDEPPGKLQGVRYGFEGGYKLSIHTRQLRHTRRFDANRNWNLDGFSQEVITGIVVRRFGSEPYEKSFGETYP